MTNLTIITEIQTKPRPRFAKMGGFVRTYTPKTALTYERYIASEYQRLGGEYFGDVPLIVHLNFYFKVPKNTPKWKMWAIDKGEVYCNTHKDLDNLAKSVLDALNTVAYDDDKQITLLHISKHWTTGQERVEICIYQPAYLPDDILKERYKNERHN